MALFFTSHSSLLFSPASSINTNPFLLSKPPRPPPLSFSCKPPKTLRFHPQITKQPRFPTLLTHTSSSDPSSDPDPEPKPTPVSITDEWGEKAEPDPEYLKDAGSDPPRNDDEWGEQFVAAGNGTAAAPSTSSAVDVEKDSRNEDLKRCLVDTVYGTEFGYRASPEIRAEVLELVNQLEAVNPTPAPVDATSMLDGKWVLVYTAFSELLPLLAAGATPLLKVKSISQTIDSSNLSIVNSTALSSPFATFSFSTSATFEVRTPSRIQVEFKEGTLQPPEINSNIDLPGNIDIFGQKINLSSVQQSLNPLQEAAANIGRTLSGQPPLKVPLPGNQATSWLLITYLDEDLRISRGDGGLFVLAKEGSPLLEL
ncbi:plastid lipid-associated protein [Salix suchowensis]|nr:plastid lipid-associated protein [Salix suchowensis]